MKKQGREPIGQMALKQWFLTNYKDVLADDSKVYSPATCVFIPQ